MNKDLKHRLTAFIDPVLVKRAKVQGALEGLTISEVVEKALDAYAPQIEKGSNRHLNVRFMNRSIDTVISETGIKAARTVAKRAKSLVVPR